MMFKRFKCFLFGHLRAMHVVRQLANGQSLMTPICMRCNDFAKSIEAAELNYKLVEQEFRIAYVKWMNKFMSDNSPLDADAYKDCLGKDANASN